MLIYTDLLSRPIPQGSSELLMFLGVQGDAPCLLPRPLGMVHLAGRYPEYNPPKGLYLLLNPILLLQSSMLLFPLALKLMQKRHFYFIAH